MVSLETFQEKFQNLKAVEGTKDVLIEDLIGRIKELEGGLRDEKLHREREQETTKSFQTRYHDAETKYQDAESRLRRMDEDVASNNFVSVLVDGDCMNFLDHFVSAGKQGGLEAVRCLRSAISDYVSAELKLPANIQVRIRVYANTKGLSSVYGSMDSSDDLLWFARGFNMGHPMCDFIDAGEGKECADSKLKVWFHNDLSDIQCRAVLFGGSADNGYARLLQPYAGDESKTNKIVLIEGPPFARELAGLTNQFLVTRFSNVFRNTKLSSRRVSFSNPPLARRVSFSSSPLAISPPRALALTPPPSLPSPSSTTGSYTTTSPTPNNTTGGYISTSPILNNTTGGYTTTSPTANSTTGSYTTASPTSPSPVMSTPPIKKATIPSRKGFTVLLNSKGQRLDTILNPHISLVKVLRNKKQCNSFHILGPGECPYRNCTFLHGDRLDEKSIEARRWIARQKPCLSGLQCRDEKCLLGHQCPEKACMRIGNGCHFPLEMHNVDRS